MIKDRKMHQKHRIFFLSCGLNNKLNGGGKYGNCIKIGADKAEHKAV